MAGSANEIEFTGARELANRRWAMGYRRDLNTRVGGIVNPQKTRIAPGDIIFRFGNARRTPEDDRSGPWWMTQSTLMLNAEYASGVIGLIDTLRQNLALPPSFSPMDRVFAASVRQRLTCFAGNGGGVFRGDLDPADQANTPPLWLGGMERDGSSRGVSLRFQLFIPGLAAVPAGVLDFGPVRSATEWFNQPVGQRQFP